MITQGAATIGALLLMSSCVAQQRPVLGGGVVVPLIFSQYGQGEQSSHGLMIAYPCTELKCNVDRYFEFKGPWPNGEYCIMYDSSQVPFYTVEIKAGRKHGFERYYYATGSLMRQLQYIDGLPAGLRFEFYPSGKLETVATFDSKGRFTSRYTFNEDQRAGRISRTVEDVDISEDWKLVGDSVIVTP